MCVCQALSNTCECLRDVCAHSKDRRDFHVRPDHSYRERLRRLRPTQPGARIHGQGAERQLHQRKHATSTSTHIHFILNTHICVITVMRNHPDRRRSTVCRTRWTGWRRRCGRWRKNPNTLCTVWRRRATTLYRNGRRSHASLLGTSWNSSVPMARGWARLLFNNRRVYYIFINYISCSREFRLFTVSQIHSTHKSRLFRLLNESLPF